MGAFPCCTHHYLHLSGEDAAVEEPTMDEGDDLEVLGEQLYDLIYHRHAEMAGKLTGEEVTQEANSLWMSHSQNNGRYTKTKTMHLQSPSTSAT